MCSTISAVNGIPPSNGTSFFLTGSCRSSEPHGEAARSRSDFALWAIERAKAIVSEEGGNLAIATRDQSDEEIAASTNALDQAIVNGLVEE